MKKWIQRNKKKLLGIFTALLMVIFLLPSSMKNGAGRSELVVGTVFGNEKIYGGDLADAKDDLRILQEHNFRPFQELMQFMDRRALSNHDMLYPLLLKEAQHEGTIVSEEEAAAIIASYNKTADEATPPEQSFVTAAAHILSVQAMFERATASVKITPPLLNYFLASNVQDTNVNVVQFKGSDFTATVPPPTPEQIQHQYDTYADRFPEAADTFLHNKPAVIGYKLPNRVKLQYLMLSRDDVVKDVFARMGKDLVPLFTESLNYYNAHQSDFPASSPPPSLLKLPESQPAPTTRPFSDVMDEINLKLINQDDASSLDFVVSIRKRVADRQSELRKAMEDELTKAYADWSAANPNWVPIVDLSVGPVAPNTATTYDQFAYLEQFATQFAANHGVRPTVNSLANDWLAKDGLARINGLGSATKGSLEFSEYAADDVVAPPSASVTTQPGAAATPATSPATAPSTSPTTVPTTLPVAKLKLMQPSDVLEDRSGNSYVFRVTAYDPAHDPSLQEVRPTIIHDLTTAAALQAARDQAQSVLAIAQKLSQQSGDVANYKGGLDAAAKAVKKSAVPAGHFPAALLSKEHSFMDFMNEQSQQQLFQSLQNMPDAPKDPLDILEVINGFAKLKAQTTPANRHPSILITLPSDQRVLVAEVSGVELPFPPDEALREDLGIAQYAGVYLEMGSPTATRADLTQESAKTGLAHNWFDLDSVSARVKYVSTNKKSGS